MLPSTKMVVIGILLLATFFSLTRLFAAQPINVGPSGNFKTIQAGVDAASPGDTVNVAFGAYTGNVVIGKSGIIIHGAGAGRTFLNLSGIGGTAITFDNVTSSTINGFTIRKAEVGIRAIKSRAIITNNVFLGNISAFENRSSHSSVTNNAFYNNTRAIFSNNSSAIIKNNVVAGSTRYGVAGFNGGPITYNLFHGNILGNYSGVPIFPSPDPDAFHNRTGNPIFVNSTSDFHLKTGSPAIKTGDPSLKNSFNNITSDIGAYGGPQADVTPAAVSNVSAASATDKATISWNKNMAYNISGYRIYYRKPAETYTSTSFVPAGDTASIDLTSPAHIQANQRYYFAVTSMADNSTHESDKSPEVPGAIDSLPPSAPSNLAAAIGDKRLYLTWSPAVDNESGVKGYRVYYGTSAGSYLAPIDVGNVTSYELTGLSNGTTYYMAISAYDYAGNAGGLSSEVSQSPQEVRGIAGLKSTGGCFIATAAYGSYEERHVKVLREFRDRYLLTNIPGSAFVSLYYTASPPIADFITEHTWLKPVVRVALLPLIAFSWLSINHPLLAMSSSAFLVMSSILSAFIDVVSIRKRSGRIWAGREIALLIIFLCLPAASFGDETTGFSFGLSYGQLDPSSDRWKEIYDSDRISNYRVSLGYRFNPSFGAEVGGGYLTKNGNGRTVTGVATGAGTTFQMAPVDMTIIYRLNYFPGQIIIPYVGGGVNYNLYWEKITDGKELKGGMWGHHVTGGIQLLLDRLDKSSARSLKEDYRIDHTYLVIGATHFVINDFGGEDVDLGGWNYHTGLVFEF